MQHYDTIYDLQISEDNFDVEQILFEVFADSYGSYFDYEQIPLLKALITLLCSNISLLDGKSEPTKLQCEEVDIDHYL